MKILAVAENDRERAEISKITDQPVKFVTAGMAAEELRKKNYAFVISAPQNVFFTGRALSYADIKEECVNALYEFFLLRSGLREEQLRNVKAKIANTFQDSLEAENALKEIYTTTIEKLFEQNEWLELYISRDIFTGTGEQLAMQLTLLYKEYAELFPKCTDKAAEVIYYILNNPESDLKQKTIAHKLYINSSYLSTVFAVQTGMRYVDYLTAVKLKRAAYLIMNTNLGIGEIAERLDYKDIGYFSRLFKSRYGMPPSQYRLPYNYTYEI